MDDLAQLEARIRERLTTAQAHRQQSQEKVSREMKEYERRLNQFKAIAKRLLHKVIIPRLKVLAGLFPNAQLTEGGSKTTHLCDCNFDHTPEFPASTKLEISILPDDQIKCIVINYKLEILPVFFEFDREDRLEFPLDEMKEQAVASWVNSKLLQFTDTYLKLQLVPQYQEENVVVDPVCGMRINKAAAATTAEHEGQTYYFCVEECRQKFLQAPKRYLARP